MAKYSIRIDGASNIGALAVGSGATAYGSSIFGKCASTNCPYCWALTTLDRKDREIFHAVSKISIEMED